MIVAVNQGELATLATQLPPGKLRDWCKQSSGGNHRVVYVKQATLSACRSLASSPVQVESTIPTIEESKPSEEFQGQRGPDMASIADAGQNSDDAREVGVGYSESDTLPTDSEQLD